MKTSLRTLKLASPLLAVAFLSACSGGAESESKDAAAPAATDTAAPADTAAAPAATATFASLTANEANGEKVFKQCLACHSLKEGENKVGPSMHGLVGRPAGQVAGFNYSAANKNSGKTWTEETMFAYLEAPQKFIPGTKMAFAGLKNPQDRVDVIAYIKSHD